MVIYLEYGYNFVVDMSYDKNLLSFVRDVTNLLDISFEIGENSQIAPEALAHAKWATLKRICDLKAGEEVHSKPLNEWIEYIDRQEAPDNVNDPESAVVQHLLSSWSQKDENIKYITNWLQILKNSDSKLPHDFPMGMQLVNLDETLKNNFLAILIPAIDVHLGVEMRRALRSS